MHKGIFYSITDLKLSKHIKSYHKSYSIHQTTIKSSCMLFSNIITQIRSINHKDQDNQTYSVLKDQSNLQERLEH